MTLAGSIKLRNFLLLVVLVLGALTAVGFVACHGKTEGKPTPTVETATPAVSPTAPTAPTPPADAASVTASASDLAARPYDAEVLAWRGKSLPGGKGKDVHKGVAYKINVYMDSGKSTVNRAKVDANRNDKFDDKYTFDGETITLQRAPADDEHYTETYHWNGSGWSRAP